MKSVKKVMVMENGEPPDDWDDVSNGCPVFLGLYGRCLGDDDLDLEHDWDAIELKVLKC